MRISPWELLVVLVVVLMVFGPKRLPELGKAIGRTIREFRHATSEKDEEEKPANPADGKGKG